MNSYLAVHMFVNVYGSEMCRIAKNSVIIQQRVPENFRYNNKFPATLIQDWQTRNWNPSNGLVVPGSLICQALFRRDRFSVILTD